MHRRLNVKDGHVGFRRRATLDDSPETARETRLAIARTKEGDRDALRFLYTRYSDNVYGYICSIVRDEQEAEDLTQHVFMKLITVIVQYKDHGIPFTGWLLRLSRNVALDHLRRRRPTPTEEVFGSVEIVDEDARDRARDLHSALARLPEEQRDVMVMRHIVGSLSAGDSRADGSHRELGPRPAPSWPSGATGRVESDSAPHRRSRTVS